MFYIDLFFMVLFMEIVDIYYNRVLFIFRFVLIRKSFVYLGLMYNELLFFGWFYGVVYFDDVVFLFLIEIL